MIKFIKFFQLISIVLFLPMLILVYAYLPEEVALTTDQSGPLHLGVSREVFFYAILFLFTIANVLCISLGKALRAVPPRQPKSGTVFFDAASKSDIIAWVKSFNFILNTLFIFSLFYIGFLNNSESIKGNDFSFFLYIGPVLIIIWFFIFGFILLKRTRLSRGS